MIKWLKNNLPFALPIVSAILLGFVILPWMSRQDTADFINKSESYLSHNWSQTYEIDFPNSDMTKLTFYSNHKKYTVEKSFNGQDFQIVLK